MAWIFGEFRLDPERFELARGGEPVRLEPQVLALLVLLIRNRDRMVTKEEIADDVWQGRTVSDASISSRIRSARRAVDDDGADQAVIRTVHGRGFRFVADVVEMRTAQAAATEIPEQAGLLTGRPSIAILPFRPLAMAPELAILADAAKYDASCSSSGGSRKRDPGGMGNSEGMGICHSYAPDGRCISLLKILLTNYCI